MTLLRERAEMLMAEHAAGKSARAIARAYGHNRKTVQNYASGRRIPGVTASRADVFAPFADYCRQRLADDPHLRAAALLAEINRIGFPGTERSFYRALARHEIRTHPCPDCKIARISGYAPIDRDREAGRTRPSPLPVPAVPLAGETLMSFLGRLAAANFTSTEGLVDILPAYFRRRARLHDDRWQHDQLAPWADTAADALATISGSAVSAALPAFGVTTGQPVRAVTACHRCAAVRGILHPVPVHLPAWQQVCLKHGIWLSAPGAPQFSVRSCPDILAAERRARQLARRLTTEQLICARMSVAIAPADPGQARRTAAIAQSSHHLPGEPGQELQKAAAYPDQVAAVARVTD